MSGKILSFPGYNKRSKCFLNNYHTLGTLLSALSELSHLVFTIILWRLFLSSPPYQCGNRGHGNLTCPRSPSWLTKQSHSRACVVNLCAYSLSAKYLECNWSFEKVFPLNSNVAPTEVLAEMCWAMKKKSEGNKVFRVSKSIHSRDIYCHTHSCREGHHLSAHFGLISTCTLGLLWWHPVTGLYLVTHSVALWFSSFAPAFELDSY